MKLISAIAFLLTTLNGATAFGQSSIPLSSLRPVSGSFIIKKDKVSMSDQIFRGCMYNYSNDDSDYAVYDLGGNLNRFQCWFGEGDDDTSTEARKYIIKLDGQTVIQGTVSRGDEPIHVDLDVAGAHSIRIAFEKPILLAEPMLLKAPPQSARVANLIAPTSGTKETGKSVNLLWEPVDGATSYGVEIVCTKGSSPHIYSLNVTSGDSNTKFDLTNVPNGEYQWSVIAFNGKGVMGKFSKDRTFVVAK